MTAPRIRANHDGLQQIAQSFARQADCVRQSLQSIQGVKQVLESGDWLGRGATQFYQEMDSAVLPAFSRLVQALERAAETTKQISQVMEQAEADAARLFSLDGASGGGAPFTISNMVLGAVLGATGDASPDAGTGGAGSGPRPLIASNYKTLEDLKKDITINYQDGFVEISQDGKVINSLFKSTFSEEELISAYEAAKKGDMSKAYKLRDRNWSQAFDLYTEKERYEKIRRLSTNDPKKKGKRSVNL